MKRASFASCALALVSIASGCGPQATEASLTISPDRSSFDGRTERVVFRLRGMGVGETLGTGLVHLTSTVGSFIGGTEVELMDGFATVTFSCSPETEAACVGPIRLGATWAGMSATTQVVGVDTVQPTVVRWEALPTGTTVALHDVIADLDGTAWAVGERGVVLHLVQNEWVRVPSGVSSALRAIAIAASGPVVVGDEGVLLMWDGSRFERRVMSGEDFTAVAIDSHGELHLGAASGRLSHYVDGYLETGMGLQVAVQSLAVQGDELWATGEGVLAKHTAAGWQTVQMPIAGKFSRALRGLQGVWLVGERMGLSSVSGLLVSGPSWHATALPEPALSVVDDARGVERFALTTKGLYRQVVSGEWSPVDLPAVGSAMASRGAGDLIVLGPPGITLVRRAAAVH